MTQRSIPPWRVARCKLFVGLLATLCFWGTATAQIKVALLAPDPPGHNPFWTQTIEVMQAAAADLGMELEIAYSKSNTYSNRKDGMKLLGGGDKPDYFMTGYWTGGTNALLEYTGRLGIPTFVFNSGVDPDDRDNVGGPREKYRQWIGQMTPDDERAGFSLADTLIARARAANRETGKVHVLGLGGYVDVSSNDYRQRGLNQRIKTDPDAVLERYVFAEWSRTVAYQSVLEVLKPGSPVSVIWCSGETMAVGAAEAIRELGITPGEDVFVGGIGWLRPAVESVLAGDMETTLGGHFLEGAWALVLLYDYHHGHDFADDLGAQFHTRYQPVTADNARAHLDKMGDPDWSSIDFKRFSKVHNPDLKRYRWPLADVLEQLRTAKAKD